MFKRVSKTKPWQDEVVAAIEIAANPWDGMDTDVTRVKHSMRCDSRVRLTYLGPCGLFNDEVDFLLFGETEAHLVAYGRSHTSGKYFVYELAKISNARTSSDEPITDLSRFLFDSRKSAPVAFYSS